MMKQKRVAFSALIKTINHKSLNSGDKETWVTLAFNSSRALKTLNALNDLHHADQLVSVGIVEEK
jgi:hypothetical protein